MGCLVNNYKQNANNMGRSQKCVALYSIKMWARDEKGSNNIQLETKFISSKNVYGTLFTKRVWDICSKYPRKPQNSVAPINKLLHSQQEGGILFHVPLPALPLLALPLPPLPLLAFLGPLGRALPMARLPPCPHPTLGLLLGGIPGHPCS